MFVRQPIKILCAEQSVYITISPSSAMAPGVVNRADSEPQDIDITNDLKTSLVLNGDDDDSGMATANGMEDQSTLSRLSERLEDIRDTITETESYMRISKASKDVSAVLQSVWSFSKSATWIIGTTALVLLVPLLYEMDKELAQGPETNSTPQGTPNDASSATASEPAAAASATDASADTSS